MGKRTNTAQWIESRQRWQVNVQKDGQRKTFTSTKPGRAGQREANAKADAWLDSGISPVSPKVSDAWAEYQEARRAVSFDEYKNADTYGRHYVLPRLGHKRVNSLTEQDLQDVLDYAFRHPASVIDELSRKTLQTILSHENAFLKYCRKKRWTTLHPEDLKVPAAARKCEKTILNAQELLKLFNVDTTVLRGKRVFDEFIYYYRFQVLTGLRPGELRGLKWENIQGETCFVRRSINMRGKETRGKNDNALRSFQMIPRACQILEQQRELTGHLKEIFPMTSMHTYYNRWQRYQRVNGISDRTSLYELRHTFVSATKSLPEGQLRQLVGHSKNMDTYGVYSHLMSDDAEQTAKAVSGAFDKILAKKA